MVDNEIEETERSLVRLKKASKVISVVFRILFYIYCLVWLALVVLFSVLTFSPELVPSAQSIDVIPLLSCLLFGFLIAALLRVATLIFADVAKGESPFSHRQIKRIRIAALVFLVYVVAEMLIPSGGTTIVPEGDWHVAYSVSEEPSASVVDLNFGMLGAAVIFYCLSLVFEYGTLLQRLSDETL